MRSMTSIVTTKRTVYRVKDRDARGRSGSRIGAAIRIALAVHLACCWVADLQAADPGQRPILLRFTDFLWHGKSADPALEAILAANGEDPPPEMFSIGYDAHAAAFAAMPGGGLAGCRLWEILTDHQSLAAARIPRRHWNRQIAAVAGRPWRAALLEIRGPVMRRARHEASRSYEQWFAGLALTMTNWQAQREAPVLFYEPGYQHCSVDRENAAWTAESDAAATAATEAPLVPLEVALNARVLPVWRAFAALRRSRPALDLHAPTDPRDTHLSARDGYLMACVAATVLLQRRCRPPAIAAQEAIFATDNKSLIHRAKKQGKPAPPPILFTAADLDAIHDAAWTAVEEWNAVITAYRHQVDERVGALAALSAAALAQELASTYQDETNWDQVTDIALMRLPAAQVTAAITVLLNEAAAATRAAGLRAARRAWIRDPGLRAALIRLLGDDADEAVRAGAAWTLACCHGWEAEAQTALIQAATDARTPAVVARNAYDGVVDFLDPARLPGFLAAVIATNADTSTWQAAIKRGIGLRPIDAAIVGAAIDREDPARLANTLYWLPSKPAVLEIYRTHAAQADATLQAVLGTLLIKGDAADGVSLIERGLDAGASPDVTAKALGLLGRWAGGRRPAAIWAGLERLAGRTEAGVGAAVKALLNKRRGK